MEVRVLMRDKLLLCTSLGLVVSVASTSINDFKLHDINCE